MDKEDVKKVLSSEYLDLVNLALSYVNLTDLEIETLRNRFMKGYTQEHTAEIMSRCVTNIKKYEKSSILKCSHVWEGISWINKLLNNA